MWFYFSKLWFWGLLAAALAGVIAWALCRYVRGARRPKVDEAQVRQLADARATVSRHESRINELLSVRARELDELTAARAQLATVDELRGRVRTLEGDAARVPGLEADLRRLSGDADRLAAVDAELTALRARAGELEAEAGKLGPLRARLKDLEGEAGRAAALAAEVAALRGQAEEATTLRHRLVDLEPAADRVPALEAELAGMRERLAEAQSAAGQVAPLHARITDLEREVAALAAVRAQLADAQAGAGRLQADIDGLRGRVHELEGEAAALAAARSELDGLRGRHDDLERQLAARPVAPVLDVDAAAVAIGAPVRADDLEVVEGIGPKIAELLHARGIRTWAGLAATEPAAIRTMLDDAGPNYRVADPATWPHQAALLAWGRWAEFRALTDDLVAGRGRVGTAPAGATDTTERAAFAVAAGSDVVDVTGAAAILGTRVLPDDLKVVEGIGPKIEELLHGGGIHTWRELADAPVERLKAILDAAGSRYQIHDPSTWPRQAALLVGARWGEFKEFTDQLRGGRA